LAPNRFVAVLRAALPAHVVEVVVGVQIFVAESIRRRHHDTDRPELSTIVTVAPELRPYSAEYAEVKHADFADASAGGRVWTPPVEPETTDTPSTV